MSLKNIQTWNGTKIGCNEIVSPEIYSFYMWWHEDGGVGGCSEGHFCRMVQ